VEDLTERTACTVHRASGVRFCCKATAHAAVHNPSTSASCVIFSMLLAWPRRARRSNPKWVEWVGTAIQLPRRQHCGRSHAEVQSQPEHTWGRLLSLEPSLYSASPALKLASWRPVDDDR
jgi:hypothetical protein